MNCYSMIWVSTPKGSREVPCGKCLACLSNKRNDWAFRLEQEYKRSQGAAFITLTYHPKFLPKEGLSKRDFQLFMKRLRSKSGKKLRYYAVGEYGSKTQRPHYHAIIFNYEGNEQFLQSIWSTPTGEAIGIVHIGKVNQASIMYCTKYIVQRGLHFNSNVSKPFMLCSRSYGLGGSYLTDAMCRWHREAERNYVLVYGEKRRLPRFYQDKIFPASEFGNWIHLRESVLKEAKTQSLDRISENRKILISLGYKNPDAIIAEMRKAMLSRIKEKIAYTQKF